LCVEAKCEQAKKQSVRRDLKGPQKNDSGKKRKKGKLAPWGWGLHHGLFDSALKGDVKQKGEFA